MAVPGPGSNPPPRARPTRRNRPPPPAWPPCPGHATRPLVRSSSTAVPCRFPVWHHFVPCTSVMWFRDGGWSSAQEISLSRSISVCLSSVSRKYLGGSVPCGRYDAVFSRLVTCQTTIRISCTAHRWFTLHALRVPPCRLHSASFSDWSLCSAHASDPSTRLRDMRGKAVSVSI